MKKWTVLTCILLLACSCMSTMAAAQTSSPVPAGTALMVRLETTLATFSNKAGDPFRARLTQAVVLNGRTVIPAGATIEGRVTRVGEPRRISGKPTIGILPEALILPTGERLFLDATLVDTNAGRNRRQPGRRVQGIRSRPPRSVGSWRRHGRWYVDRRAHRRSAGSPHRRSRRRRLNRSSLAEQASLGHADGRHRTHARTQPSAGDDHRGCQRGTVKKSELCNEAGGIRLRLFLQQHDSFLTSPPPTQLRSATEGRSSPLPAARPRVDDFARG